MIQGSRLRQIGWAAALGICITCFLALSFRVNAVKSEVRLAERNMIALVREKNMLETEFQTRASQQNLAEMNRVEFGYHPPEASQFLENERQLAALGRPRSVDAPAPIRVAQAPVDGDEGALPAMLSPVTGRPAKAAEIVRAEHSARAEAPVSRPGAQTSLAERLGRVGPLAAAGGHQQ